MHNPLPLPRDGAVCPEGGWPVLPRLSSPTFPASWGRCSRSVTRIISLVPQAAGPAKENQMAVLQSGRH